MVYGKITEGNHTYSSTHLPIKQKPQTRGLGGYGSSSSAPPTPQRSFPMQHGQQEVQPSITLGITWSKLTEDMSQRDILQRPYGNHQRMESHQAVQTPGEEGNQIRENQATIQTIEEHLNQRGPTLIPSGSQGVDQPSSPLTSHHSGTSRSVAKSHHSPQSQVFSRRRKGYKGKNKTSSSQRQKESERMIQKL
ncbi:hypothetical protein O181_001203 [Austropuccinia psidii MF-1]|uniref:Uncharacterized protein n=1 Tax=Austropuccinia psidii MF-1 TaxID=1389203 RepID=A0A9Q3BAB3_9BASI|nr:hypothetical protein [Austropuccinia psidii MF-1]